MESPQKQDDTEKFFDIATTPRKFPISTRSRASLSLFDLAVEAAPSKKSMKTEYENRLHKETIDWNHLLKGKLNEIIKAKNDEIVIDKSVLTKDQIAYLELADRGIEIGKGSEEFLIKARIYLEEYQQFIEKQEQLVEIVEQQLKSATSDLIYSCKYSETNTANIT